MRDQNSLKKRNEKILQRYTDMYFGQFMRDDLIYEILADEFFLSKLTIYRIILEYKKDN